MDRIMPGDIAISDDKDDRYFRDNMIIRDKRANDLLWTLVYLSHPVYLKTLVRKKDHHMIGKGVWYKHSLLDLEMWMVLAQNYDMAATVRASAKELAEIGLVTITEDAVWLTEYGKQRIVEKYPALVR
ncbi:MAG: hypothetical protein A2288_02780 [Candidatus Moranbacteria bacterium RIFOXYA12_FULL_44_15]|nr:MAG: hypothetical protein A2288_02780 [Candidatus Moranbacteria bacterium RIFOXYA12_FULL_44_15]OGI34215.1 MAG: hypothetical protein A2259_04055 [Candidatus Moranbacteria bacterium RIFOXYA2_FULL_43_15]